VLFADLKGSMELLVDRDPEEARKLLDPVLERMMEAVHRYEGTVNQRASAEYPGPLAGIHVHFPSRGRWGRLTYRPGTRWMANARCGAALRPPRTRPFGRGCREDRCDVGGPTMELVLGNFGKPSSPAGGK
jgi:class 3 adenylate cyclase